MNVIENNVNLSVSLSLTALKIFGFWAPDGLSWQKRWLYNCYAFISFMFLLGTYLIIQVVDMFMIWGDLPLMTGTAFLLFTNLAQATKIASLVLRRRTVGAIIADADQLLRGEEGGGREIVKSCNRETSLQQLLYFCLTTVTVAGWAGSAEKNQLPLRAWYPYDTSKSPAYELTYMHQVGALFIAAYLNVGKDTLVTTLIAQCRCRLRLLGLGLSTLCDDLVPNEQMALNTTQYILRSSRDCRNRQKELVRKHSSSILSLLQDWLDGMLTPDQEKTAWSRLRVIVRRHQAALEASTLLQECFSAPIFAQFMVSMVIICVTAFQLAAQTGNLVRLFSMGTYLLNMTFQVFLYCYQGNQLSEESIGIAGAAYSCPWYSGSTRLRRGLLVLMVRTRRAARLTAGGFTTLSLTSFMAIVKTSYSLFTVLQQAEESNN